MCRLATSLNFLGDVGRLKCLRLNLSGVKSQLRARKHPHRLISLRGQLEDHAATGALAA